MDSNPNILTKAAIELMFQSGVSHVFARWLAGRGAVYMFHSIVPRRSACLAPGFATSAAFLDQLLTSFRRSGIDIIAVTDLIPRLENPKGRHFVVATFDDGYADNLQHALPIFEKHHAPMTIYVTTGMITGSLYCWWAALDRLFLQNSVVEILPMEKQWKATTFAEKAKAFSEASGWVTQDITGRAPLLRSTFAHYGLSMPEIVRGIGLSIDQLKTLGRNPLVTIGGHTASHPELPRLDQSEARHEIVTNKRFLEDALQKSIDHFSYPYGAHQLRDRILVNAAGYKTAVTTRDGCVSEQDVQRPHILPRVGSSPYESIGLAHLKVDGLIAALRHA
jgi:peptidoglycan/xylan/chitin deacetylase (PgdA/CDA1 family)